MSWGEAWRLTRQLMTDPASHVAAAAAGWEYPASREALVLMALFDLQHASKSKKRPPSYPRPWGTEKETKRFGRTNLSREQVIAVLAEHGHGQLNGGDDG